jgi:hypothetical protein
MKHDYANANGRMELGAMIALLEDQHLRISQIALHNNKTPSAANWSSSQPKDTAARAFDCSQLL